MIQTLLIILLTVILAFLEPALFYTLSISLYLVLGYFLLKNRFNALNTVILILTGIIIDTTLKYYLGTHLVVLMSAILVNILMDRFIPNNLGIFNFFKIAFSFLIGLLILAILKRFTFEISYLTANILPSLISAIFYILLKYIFTQVGSGNTVNTLKIK